MSKNPMSEVRGQKSGVDYDDLLTRRYEEFCSELGDDGCYGLGMEINRRLGKPLPDFRLLALNIANQEKIERFRPGFEKINFPEPGDLVLIRAMDMESYHIGIIIESGYFLEATKEAGVRRVRLNNLMVKDRIEGIYRYNCEL
jgi:cell wall-associated NlpC family hydrolase